MSDGENEEAERYKVSLDADGLQQIAKMIEGLPSELEAAEKIARENPTEGLRLVRESFSERFGLPQLPLTSFHDRISTADRFFLEWMFYCAQSTDDLRGEIEELIKVLKQLQKRKVTKTDIRYLKIINDYDNGMTEEEMNLKWNPDYKAAVEELNNSTDEDEKRWQREEIKESARLFEDNLRQAENRIGTRRKHRKNPTHTRRSKYKTNKEN
jgi:hypothetical protein